MSKKGENIYKRKDGRWEGRYIRLYDENGKAKYGYVYGKNYSDVKQRLLEKKAYSGSQADMASKCSALYSEVLDAWLQSTRINIKESTYARYSHLIDTHIRSQLGKYQISKISTQLIEGFIENLLSCGRVDNNGGLSAKTVTDILTIVKSTIDYARYNNLVVSCNLSKLTIKKKDKEMRVLCQSEQDALIRVLIADMDLYKFGVLLSLYTGKKVNDLNSKINQYNSQISQLNSNIKSKESQIDELNRLKSKYQKLQNDFANRQSKRVNTFNVNFSKNLNLKFIRSYISGMKSLLSGNDYKRSYNGLSSAIGTISNKIKSIQREIDSLKKDINSKQRSIDSIRRDISSYQSQINRTNSNLSYRRQRITYWKNQLRYAR